MHTTKQLQWFFFQRWNKRRTSKRPLFCRTRQMTAIGLKKSERIALKIGRATELLYSVGSVGSFCWKNFPGKNQIGTIQFQRKSTGKGTLYQDTTFKNCIRHAKLYFYGMHRRSPKWKNLNRFSWGIVYIIWKEILWMFCSEIIQGNLLIKQMSTKS